MQWKYKKSLHGKFKAFNPHRKLSLLRAERREKMCWPKLPLLQAGFDLLHCKTGVSDIVQVVTEELVITVYVTGKNVTKLWI